MKTVLSLFAVALSTTAFAQQSASQAGLWPVQTAAQTCTMSQSFADPDFGKRTLSIGYDASRQEVSLTATNTLANTLPDSGELGWRIVFLNNGGEAHDDAWGTRRFSYVRDGDGYRFSTRFAGEKNVRQILADLAASRGLGFMDGDEVVTAFDLEGIDRPIERLRACAGRALAGN